MKQTKKITAVLLSLLLCFGMLAFPAAAEDAATALPESDHPYANDFDETWEYEFPEEVDGFFMTFSEETHFEPVKIHFTDEDGNDIYYTMDELDQMIAEEEARLEAAGEDPFYAYDNVLEGLTFVDYKNGDGLAVFVDGMMLDVYDDDQLAGRTIYIPGAVVTLELFTDESVTDYGFKVVSVSAEAPEGCLTVTYYLEDEKPAAVECFTAGEEVMVYSNAGILTDDASCIGWSDTRGGDMLYEGGETITPEESISFYPVYTPILLRPDEVFSFDNDDDPFAVNQISVQKDGYDLLSFSNYHLEQQDYTSLLKNIARTLGVSPLGMLSLYNAALYPVSIWGGSCYGISLSVALQHYGMLDMLSLQEGAECVRDLEGTPELVSCINYYQAQETAAKATQYTVNNPGSAWYKMQLQKMFETVAGGDIVLFGLYEGATYNSAGHAVLLVGAYDDLSGNHVLIAYDSNFGSDYANGDAWTFFYIPEDYSAIYCDWYYVEGFDWLSDFSGFDAFRMDGSGDSASWYKSVLNHLKDFFAMLKAFFTAFRLKLQA